MTPPRAAAPAALAALLALSLADAGVRAADPSAPQLGVAELDVEGFSGSVGNGDEWLVQFYAPWCGWCKKLAPVWESVGRSLRKTKGISVGKFSATQRGSGVVTEKYDVGGFPTIVFIKPHEASFVRYEGRDKTANAVLGFARGHSQVEIPRHVDASDDDGTARVSVGAVATLTGNNAEALIGDPELHVFVKFFAPWCGHCRDMEAEYADLARASTREDTVIAEVDASRHGRLATVYSITGFPTLIVC